MLNSKTLMTYLLTLMMSFTIVACDDECDSETAGDEMAEDAEAGGDDACEEAGTEAGEAAGEAAGDEAGGEAGDEAGAEVEVAAFSSVVIQDITEDINDDGTPGVDICEISLTCDGTPISEVAIGVEPGSDWCDGSNNDNCICPGEAIEGICGGTDRGNSDWLFDDDDSCSGDNWTSIGINGRIVVDAEIEACDQIDVSVAEKDDGAGMEVEGFIVALCSDTSALEYNELMFGDACVVIGSAENGGSNTWTWNRPAAEEPAEEESDEESDEETEEDGY